MILGEITPEVIQLMPKVVYTLDAINQRLSAKGAKVRLVRRGQALSLQATLPPKPLSQKRCNHQQRIPLNMSCPDDQPRSKAILKAREVMLRKAESEAEALSNAILYNTFSWDNYRVQGVVNSYSTAEIIEQFKKHYFERHTLYDRTWEKNWMRYLCKLPQNEPLSAEGIVKTIAECSRPDTTIRKFFCNRYKALSEFAKIEVDLLPFEQSIDRTPEPKMAVPTDEVLLSYRPVIEGRYRKSQMGWQWFYSILFVAGLRPHEAFFCQWGDDGLEVLKGKTGPRVVLYEVMELMSPGKIEEWNLRSIKLPGIDAEKAYENGSLGSKISTRFGKVGMQINAYDLRHAFAIRGIKYNVPSRTMAAMMGHSEKIHIDTYRKRISVQHNKDILRGLLNGNG